MIHCKIACFPSRTFFLLTLLTFFAACQNDDDDPILKACFTQPTTLTRNTPLTFDATCSVGAESYFWDFGDGESASTMAADHIYKSTGQFTVKLRVQSKASKDSVVLQIVVNPRTEESACLPQYILPIDRGLWPHLDYDSIAFLYRPDNKLQDIKWFITNKALIPSHRAQCSYNAKGDLIEIQLMSLTAINPMTEKLTSTFFIHHNSNGLPDMMTWINSYGDSVRTSTFTYDNRDRLSEIRNWWLSGNGFHKTRYVYGADDNPVKVFYTLAPGDYYPEMLARVNNSFDASVPFYAGVKELKIYFEYLIQIEPYLNNYKSSHLYQSIWPTGECTFWGGGPWNATEGVEQNYEIKLNNDFLVTYLRPSAIRNGPETEMRFYRAGYTCK
jgi:PKD repeat protein